MMPKGLCHVWVCYCQKENCAAGSLELIGVRQRALGPQHLLGWESWGGDVHEPVTSRLFQETSFHLQEESCILQEERAAVWEWQESLAKLRCWGCKGWAVSACLVPYKNEKWEEQYLAMMSRKAAGTKPVSPLTLARYQWKSSLWLSSTWVVVFNEKQSR